MRTLPLGRSVAVCPERGESIGAAGFNEPALEDAEVDTGEEPIRNAVAATAKLSVMRPTSRRRERFMMSS
jgi:hypothetical protein